MVDTVRTRAALLTLLADNTSGDISPQDARDVLVSTMVPDPANVYWQYVSKSGNDSNDGLSWPSAKLTVAAAIAALPEEGTNPNIHRAGRIYVGPGQFTESGELQWGQGLEIIGAGSRGFGGGQARGTSIKLADTSNKTLWKPPTGFVDSAHFCIMRHLELDGNYTNQTKSDTGTATSGGNDTLTNTNKTWGTLTGQIVHITGGTGSGQWRRIKSNTTQVLTLETKWATNPNNTSTYEIFGPYDLVQSAQGGYLNYFFDVHFKNASRFGFNNLGASMNCDIIECAGSDCQGGFLHQDGAGGTGAGVWNIVAFQADNSAGDTGFSFDIANNVLLSVHIAGVKFEQDGAGNYAMDDCIRFRALGANINCHASITGINTLGRTTVGGAVVHVADIVTNKPHIIMNGMDCYQYATAFKDEASGYSYPDNHLTHWVWNSVDPNRATALAKAGVPSDSDIPEGAQSGNIVIDTTNNRIYARVGSTWRYATLT